MADKKRTWGCLGCAVLLGLLGCGGVISLAILGTIIGPRGDETPQATPAVEKTIAYEVLRKEKRRGDGKLFLEVLVSKDASKQDVLKLAERLRREHDGKFAHVVIFDSREAWKHQPAMERAALEGRTYQGYSEKELDRHWLVVIAGDLGQEIRWVAKGRDH